MSKALSTAPLDQLSAADLRDITAALGNSVPCADALHKKGINGEALATLLDMTPEKSADLLLGLLPEETPMGEKLKFVRRIQEKYEDNFIISGVKRRSASKLMPLLLIAYLIYCFYNIVESEEEEKESESGLGADSESVNHMFSWLGWAPQPGTA